MKLVLFDTRIVEIIIYLNFCISALLFAITILIIAMSILVLFCFILNLTDAFKELSFSRGTCRAGTSQLISDANHLTVSCIAHIYPCRCVLWRARVGIFIAFKSQTQVISNTENPLLFLNIFLFFINYIYAKLNYLISFFYISFVDKRYPFKLILPCIKVLLYCCSDVLVD